MKAKAGSVLICLIVAAALMASGCAPAAGADTEPTSLSAHVTISIECSHAAQVGLEVPEDGWLLAETAQAVQPDETVWDVLSRVCRDNGITVAKQGAGSAVFVTNIGGITAMDAKSGWMYSVNGDYVSAGAGICTVSDGDVILWRYTADSGNDLE